MATNWGKTVAVIPLTDKTDLHINADAEMDGEVSGLGKVC